MLKGEELFLNIMVYEYARRKHDLPLIHLEQVPCPSSADSND